MAEEKQSNGGSQLNLAVIALVSLVAIVSLVALVMNAAGVKTVATDSRAVEAQSATQNVAGQARHQIPVDPNDTFHTAAGCQLYADSAWSAEANGDPNKFFIDAYTSLDTNSESCRVICNGKSWQQTAENGC